MAVNIRENRVASTRPVGHLGRLLERLKFSMADWPLTPRGYWLVPLPQNGQAIKFSSYTGFEDIEGGPPAGASTVVINVEGGPLRYSDSTTTDTVTGELYPAGASFARSIKDLGAISLSAANSSAGVIAHVSFYGVY